jgi:hypothetical protein
MKLLHRLIRVALVILLIAAIAQLAWGIHDVRHPVRGGHGEIGEDALKVARMNVEFGAFWTSLWTLLLIVHAIVKWQANIPLSKPPPI